MNSSKVLLRRCLGLDDAGLIMFGPGLRASPAAVQALKALCSAAAQEGFEVAVASAWRGFARQFTIFDEKFRGLRPVLDQNEEPLDISAMSTASRVSAIMRFSAVPGFSRHHFGTDLDIYPVNLLPPGVSLRLTAAEYAPGQYFYPFGQWLRQNLKTFGFIRPYDGSGAVGCEPWHISFAEEAETLMRRFQPEVAARYLKWHHEPWCAAAAGAALCRASDEAALCRGTVMDRHDAAGAVADAGMQVN